MVAKPPDPLPAERPRQRTGVDDARDRGKEWLERIGALSPEAELTTWQGAACAALGDLAKPEVPRGQLDLVLVLAVTKAIDDHTEKMARLAETLNVLTGALVGATILLVLVALNMHTLALIGTALFAVLAMAYLVCCFTSRPKWLCRILARLR
jgi:hypothetical protein